MNFKEWILNEAYMTPKQWLVELYQNNDRSTVMAAIDDYESPGLVGTVNPDRETPDLQPMYSGLASHQDEDKRQEVLKQLWNEILQLIPDIHVNREEQAFTFQVHENFYRVSPPDLRCLFIQGWTNYRIFDINGMERDTVNSGNNITPESLAYQRLNAPPIPGAAEVDPAEGRYFTISPEQVPDNDVNFVYLVALFVKARHR